MGIEYNIVWSWGARANVRFVRWDEMDEKKKTKKKRGKK